MGGGLMQLVAYGAQDIYLTGNPQITFFKVVYRRHTNFSMESIQQTFQGNPSWGSRAAATISRNGDLINSAYLYVVLPALNNSMWTPGPNFAVPSNSPSGPSASLLKDGYALCWTNFVGLALIDHVTIDIGGQEIDKHYGLWMYAWQELTMTSEKATGYKRMVGGYDASGWLLINNALSPQELHIPLDFWFNINAGLSLPLIALQYHEVKFHFKFRNLNELVVLVDPNGNHMSTSDWTLNCKCIDDVKMDLYIDYIYLDTDERRRFAQMSHEYLIEQVQHMEGPASLSTGSNQSTRLTFNHPCKELIWMFTRQDNIDNNDFFNFSNSEPGMEKLGTDMLTSAHLKLNGHHRLSSRGPLYFRQWQPFIHHTSIPNSCLYVYSFALRPEEHQPSGTCNFSRIDNTMLEYTLDSSEIIESPVIPEIKFKNGKTAHLNIFARNYNVLRIMSGMGGMAYSN